MYQVETGDCVRYNLWFHKHAVLHVFDVNISETLEKLFLFKWIQKSQSRLHSSSLDTCRDQSSYLSWFSCCVSR